MEEGKEEKEEFHTELKLAEKNVFMPPDKTMISSHA